MTLNYGEVAGILERLPATVDIVCRLFDMSHRELARRAGISPASISRLMHGGDMSMPNAIALLRALDALRKPSVPAPHAMDVDQEL